MIINRAKRLNHYYISSSQSLYSMFLWNNCDRSSLQGNRLLFHVSSWISKRPLRENKACAYQGIRNVRFFGKSGMICFLVMAVLRFVLLPYYRRNVLYRKPLAQFIHKLKGCYSKMIVAIPSGKSLLIS